MMYRVLMIIPAYNEEDNIKEVIERIRDFSKKNMEYFLDYIVINDGSTDSTQKVCKKNGIKHINLINNLGIGGAVQTGYIYAEKNDYDIAVQFDGDGQHDINSLRHLIKPILDAEANFVVGSRFLNETSQFKSTFMRRIGIKYLSGVIRVFTGKKIYDPTSGFRAADKAVIKSFTKHYPIDYPEPESIVCLIKNSYKIKEVQVNMFAREGGVSSIRSWKSSYYMFKVSLAIICTSFQKKRKIHRGGF